MILPKRVRSKTQVRRERRALKKLRDAGIIKRVDLRKPPTAAQKRALKKFADVVAGKAKILKPKNPKQYRKLYRVVGDKVIVPRKRGARVKVNKAGEITGTRTVRGRKVRSTLKARTPDFQPRDGAGYAIPFARGGGGVEWMRFPNWEELRAFMSRYGTYKEWELYAEEILDDEWDDETLDERHERRMGKIRRAKSSRSTRAMGRIKRNAAGKRKGRTSAKRTRRRI